MAIRPGAKGILPEAFLPGKGKKTFAEIYCPHARLAEACGPLLDRLFSIESAIEVARHPALTEQEVARLLREHPQPAEMAAVP